MPRNRSKKPAQERSREEIEDRENSDSENEEQLEHLVLGDELGFKEQLAKGLTLEEDDEFEDEEDAEEADEREEVDVENVDDADLFFLDEGPGAFDHGALVLHQDDEDSEDGDAPAWEDSDDERLTISLAGDSRRRKLRVTEAEDVVSGKEYTRRLHRQFLRLNPLPEWAQPSERPAKRRRRSSAGSASSRSSDEMAMDLDALAAQPLARILQDVYALTTQTDTSVSTKRTKLRPEVIAIEKTRDIPLIQPSAINALSFHPALPILLSAGPAATLYLHRLDTEAHPTPHPLITSVHVRHTPISCTSFTPTEGKSIIFSGRRRYFHSWDLETGAIQKITRIYGHQDSQQSMERFKLSPCGKYMALVGSSRKGGGVINVLDARTFQWIAEARQEGLGGIADFAWWANGEGMCIAGKGGEVGEWSLISRRFVACWMDEGAVGTTVLSLGGHHGLDTGLGGDRWIALGSSSGIVNIYDRKKWTKDTVPARPEPTKRFMNLTTPTSCLAFSGDGQLLCMASRWKKDALRLVHLPSCTVYRNWPTGQTPLGRVTAVAWGEVARVLTLVVGTETGKIKMWEVRE